MLLLFVLLFFLASLSSAKSCVEACAENYAQCIKLANATNASVNASSCDANRSACSESCFEIRASASGCVQRCQEVEVQTPYPDCLCIDPPKMHPCEVEGESRIKQEKGDWQTATDLKLSRGDSFKVLSGTSGLDFQNVSNNLFPCKGNRIVLQQGSEVKIWNWFWSNNTAHQEILFNGGEARFKAVTERFVYIVKSDKGFFSVYGEKQSDFIVDEDKGTDIYVKVLSGSVSVETLKGSVELAEGEAAFFTPTFAPKKIQFNKTQELLKYKTPEPFDWSPVAMALAVTGAVLLGVYYIWRTRTRPKEKGPDLIEMPSL